MKLLFIHGYDAYKNINSVLESTLTAHNSTINTLSLAINTENLSDTGMDKEDLRIIDCIKQFSPSHVFIGAGGKPLTYILKLIKNININIFCISYFPGITHYRENTGFMHRCMCDLILFNSAKNYCNYVIYCNNNNLPHDNGIIFGFPILLSENNLNKSSADNSKKLKTIYVDQSIVPNTLKEKKAIAHFLVTYAKRNPQKITIVQVRDSKKNSSAHKPNYRIDNILLNMPSLPENLIISYEDVYKHLSESDLCIGIASTLLVEAMLRGITAVSISDFGIRKSYGNDFFIGSDIFASTKSLLRSKTPKKVNRKWLDQNVHRPTEKEISNLLSSMDNVKLFSRTEPILRVNKIAIFCQIYRQLYITMYSFYMKIKSKII